MKSDEEEGGSPKHQKQGSSTSPHYNKTRFVAGFVGIAGHTPSKRATFASVL